MKALLSVSPVPLTNVYVNVSPESLSVLERVPTAVLVRIFSSKLDAEILRSVGAVLGAPGKDDKVTS